MSQIEKNCQEYEKFERIGAGHYSIIYKAQNRKTKYYVAIKEIDKQRCETFTTLKFKENEIMNKIKTENSVKDIIDNKDYFYIIMELCYCNLEEYIKTREKKLSINEIKEV